MAQVLVPSLQIKRKTCLRRLRELPVAGEVLVQVGQEVSADDIVLRASLAGDLFVFRIADTLGIEAFEVVKGLRVKEGDSISEGQLLCEHRGLFGLFNSRFFAPESGVLEFISKRTGHIGVRAAARNLEISAHISGKVVEVVENKSVEIETEAAFVQGIFGIGGERRGKLYVLPIANDHEISATDIPTDCDKCVLFGGTKPSIEALELAAQRGAVGMVFGSIDDQTLKTYLGYDLGIALTGDEQVPMTLIITEGFGEIALSDRVTNVCRELNGHSVSISGATQVRAGALRPEMIIAGGQESDVSDEGISVAGLEIGSRIRLIRVPYFGKEATVVELPHKMAKIETGAEARILMAKLDDGEIVTIPRANVELI